MVGIDIKQVVAHKSNSPKQTKSALKLCYATQYIYAWESCTLINLVVTNFITNQNVHLGSFYKLCAQKSL